MTAETQDMSWGGMMKACPWRNESAVATDHGGETVSVRVKLRRPSFMKPPLSWIVPFRPERTLELDRLGTQVWRLCDGRRDVGKIADEFSARYGLTFHEARVAVTAYLKRLIQHGVLAIELPGGRAADAPGEPLPK